MTARAVGTAPRPRKQSAPVPAAWTVYVVRCADGSLYTGIATDVVRRVAEHNSRGPLAANYTRARCPVVLVYREPAATRSAAARREAEIKKMSRRRKVLLVREGGEPGG